MGTDHVISTVDLAQMFAERDIDLSVSGSATLEAATSKNRALPMPERAAASMLFGWEQGCLQQPCTCRPRTACRLRHVRVPAGVNPCLAMLLAPPDQNLPEEDFDDPARSPDSVQRSTSGGVVRAMLQLLAELVTGRPLETIAFEVGASAPWLVEVPKAAVPGSVVRVPVLDGARAHVQGRERALSNHKR